MRHLVTMISYVLSSKCAHPRSSSPPHLSLTRSPFIRAPFILQEDPTLWPHLTLITSLRLLSKYCHIGLEHMNWYGLWFIQSITVLNSASKFLSITMYYMPIAKSVCVWRKRILLSCGKWSINTVGEISTNYGLVGYLEVFSREQQMKRYDILPCPDFNPILRIPWGPSLSIFSSL